MVEIEDNREMDGFVYRCEYVVADVLTLRINRENLDLVYGIASSHVNRFVSELVSPANALYLSDESLSAGNRECRMFVLLCLGT